MWAILQFKEEKNGKTCLFVEVIPKAWIINSTSCWYPPTKFSDKVGQWIMSEKIPENNWIKFDSKILVDNLADFLKAKEKLKSISKYNMYMTSSGAESASEQAYNTRKRRKVVHLPVPRSSDDEMVFDTNDIFGPSEDDSDCEILKGPKDFLDVSTPTTSTLNSPSIIPDYSFDKTDMAKVQNKNSTNDTENFNGIHMEDNLQNSTLFKELCNRISKLETSINDVRHRVKEIHSTISTGVQDKPVSSLNLPCLPLSSMDDFQLIEKSFSNLNNRDSAILFLKSFGGANAMELVSNILRGVLTNKGATLFNWKGNPNPNNSGAAVKHSFSTTKLWSILKEFISTSEIYRGYNIMEIERRIKKWLSQGPTREKSLKKSANLNNTL